MIERGSEPVARLVPLAAPTRRVLGQDVGLFEVPADFDDDLPDEVLARFER